MEKVLVFKVWGDYAHFKKYYTTTSPLTFEFPPPTALFGIISAIVGLQKNEYLRYFQDENSFKLAVSLNNPVNKVRWTQNLIDTKKHFWKIKGRTQIRTEFLKNPSFTIYFYHSEKSIYEKLKEHLKNHTSVYSISMGLSELLANFEFIGEIGIEKKVPDRKIEINSVIPESKLKGESPIEFTSSCEIFKINYPVLMSHDRTVFKRENIVFDRVAKPVTCSVENHFQTDNGENIVFF